VEVAGDQELARVGRPEQDGGCPLLGSFSHKAPGRNVSPSPARAAASSLATPTGLTSPKPLQLLKKQRITEPESAVLLSTQGVAQLST
jgi:hypothetical protein